MPIFPQHQVTGGTRYFVQFSGILASQDNMIFSGQGRVNAIIPHINVNLSAQSVRLYDAVSFSSGAGLTPNILGVLAPAAFGSLGSGSSVPAIPVVLNAPFFSGLAVSAPSGSPGFTVVYTPNDPTVRS